MFPEPLHAGVIRELEGVAIRDLRTAAATLSAGYRGIAPVRRAPTRRPRGGAGWSSGADTARESSPAVRAGSPAATDRPDIWHLAYLVTRLPATFAAVAAVLGELAERAPEFQPVSLLDLGAGPGTATWAARETFPSLARATLVERDAGFVEIARRLLAPLPVATQYEPGALPAVRPGAHANLAVLAYVVGELPAAGLGEAVRTAWSATDEALVLVEPGTPAGYARLLAARDHLIAAGARIVAPCPHAAACPLAGGDWCHFGVRLARSREHRLVKDAELAWEDEKFAYLVATHGTGAPAPGRILRRPDLHKGHVRLRVCGPSGVDELTVTRSNRDAYRLARHARWGDAWPPDGPSRD